jgi:hypothetical protein
MGISLDNGDRISLWDIIDGDKEHAFATLLHLNGRHEHLDKRRDRPSLSNPLVHPTSFRRARDRDLKRSVGPLHIQWRGHGDLRYLSLLVEEVLAWPYIEPPPVNQLILRE